MIDTEIVYSAEELKKIQSLELKALKVIHEICDEIDVEYYLIGGTALGAIRNNGFIPWDDDIDVGMTRSNYRKFLKQARDYLPEGYFLQTPYEGKTNPYYYTKLRIDGTRFVEYCNHKLNIHHGVYVDIFPFDEVPDDEELNIKQFNRIQNLVRIFQLRQSPDANSKPIKLYEKLRATLRKLLHICVQIIPYSFLAERLEEEFTRYNGTNQSALACLNFPVRKVEYILKKDLYPLQEHLFEDTVEKIPGNIHAYLTTHYKNYMELPPAKDRYGHKPFFVDLGK